jgi:hypothetical protein
MFKIGEVAGAYLTTPHPDPPHKGEGEEFFSLPLVGKGGWGGAETGLPQRDY